MSQMLIDQTSFDVIAVEQFTKRIDQVIAHNTTENAIKFLNELWHIIQKQINASVIEPEEVHTQLRNLQQIVETHQNRLNSKVAKDIIAEFAGNEIANILYNANYDADIYDTMYRGYQNAYQDAYHKTTSQPAYNTPVATLHVPTFPSRRSLRAARAAGNVIEIAKTTPDEGVLIDPDAPFYSELWQKLSSNHHLVDVQQTTQAPDSIPPAPSDPPAPSRRRHCKNNPLDENTTVIPTLPLLPLDLEQSLRSLSAAYDECCQGDTDAAGQHLAVALGKLLNCTDTLGYTNSTVRSGGSLLETVDLAI